MWCRPGDDDSYVVGVSDHAQASLGEIAYIELPAVGATITQGEALGVIESVKVVNDLLAPISGTVVDVNDSLADSPTTVTERPYEYGWMLRVKPGRTEELDELMDHAGYTAFIG
jgi:glycine cleavage system H protein